MRIVEARIFALKIPFRFSFGHFLKIHFHSESMVVELVCDTGQKGYGEGIARSYVTGESTGTSMEHIATVILPAIVNKEIKNIETGAEPMNALSNVSGIIPEVKSPGIIAWNAARSAVELALVDCMLRQSGRSLGALLPPAVRTVTYSAVMTKGNTGTMLEMAESFRQAGFQYIKMKVGNKNDLERVAAVRKIVGDSVSIRLDANGAFSVKRAVEFACAVKRYNISCIEQPVMRGNVGDLAAVKAGSPIPIMADESIVTLDDAQKLIEHRACDYLNLRISKCGGLYNTLLIARLAARSGMKIQMGCMVGETAILSAAGRHLAAFLPDAKFVEGSYGTHLLVDDIARESINFGKRGEAPVLTGIGLGIEINEQTLAKYARKTILVR